MATKDQEFSDYRAISYCCNVGAPHFVPIHGAPLGAIPFLPCELVGEAGAINLARTALRLFPAIVLESTDTEGAINLAPTDCASGRLL